MPQPIGNIEWYIDPVTGERKVRIPPPSVGAQGRPDVAAQDNKELAAKRLGDFAGAMTPTGMGQLVSGPQGNAVTVPMLQNALRKGVTGVQAGYEALKPHFAGGQSQAGLYADAPKPEPVKPPMSDYNMPPSAMPSLESVKPQSAGDINSQALTADGNKRHNRDGDTLRLPLKPEGPVNPATGGQWKNPATAEKQPTLLSDLPSAEPAFVAPEKPTALSPEAAEIWDAGWDTMPGYFSSNEDGVNWAYKFKDKVGYFPWEGAADYASNLRANIKLWFDDGYWNTASQDEGAEYEIPPAGLPEAGAAPIGGGGGGGFGGFYGGFGGGYGGGGYNPYNQPFRWPFQARGI